MVSRPADPPPDETRIWRYMDLAKFASIAFSRNLWFPKLAELWRADRWEGFGRAKGLARPSRKLPKNASLQLDVAQVLTPRSVVSPHRPSATATSTCTQARGAWAASLLACGSGLDLLP
jgi:hypothetical protein